MSESKPKPAAESISALASSEKLHEHPFAMTTEEIQHHVATAIRKHFTDYSTESGEMMTSEGGDGRFLGKVTATRYSGLPPNGQDLFLAIGLTEKNVQIVKFGKTECLKPSKDDLDMILQKELGIE